MENNLKIGLIVPYFGKLPNYFYFWLETCKNNMNIDWLLFIDDLYPYEYPNNVHIKYTNLKKIRNRIQSKFNFQISLDNAYKLCDYRPAYGYIFDKELKSYDYWGYCDIDLLFGDLKKFISKSILINFDKIFVLGHLSIYKNNEKVRTAFMLPQKNGNSFKRAFSNKSNMIFDEINSNLNINRIMIDNGFKLYDKNVCADIKWTYFNFRLNHYVKGKRKTKSNKPIPIIFAYKNNKIMGLLVNKDKKLIKKEYAYVHFQKRRIYVNVQLDKIKEFLLIPNKIMDYKNITITDIFEFSKSNRKYEFSMKIKRLINGVKRRIQLLNII